MLFVEKQKDASPVGRRDMVPSLVVNDYSNVIPCLWLNLLPSRTE